jgi:hypothetical protein
MKTTIICPRCSTNIDVNKVLYYQLEEEFNYKLQEREKEYKQMLEERLNSELREEKRKLRDKIKYDVMMEYRSSMDLMKKELREKTDKIKELNRSKAEIARLKREKEEIESQIKAQAEEKLHQELRKEREKISKEIQEQSEVKLRQKDEQLEQIKRELENTKRKAEQGSMQIQGEAMELAIESWLRIKFPFDTIAEIKKGAFGADCVQTVNTRDMVNCGVICYESKNTKAWSDNWIDKLKQDMLKVNANIGVLVTSVYPKGMDTMGFVDGIWVCNFSEFKGSVFLLRDSLIKVHRVVQREENKIDKMTLLYNYMTGSEFNMQLNSIVNGFIKMQDELNKEKRSLMASWKRRQKLIDMVLENTTQMYGILQGIAGSSSIANIEALELPFDDFEE